MPKQPTAKKRKKVDWSRATRPHQVQDAQALVERGKEARRKQKEQGRKFEDQSP